MSLYDAMQQIKMLEKAVELLIGDMKTQAEVNKELADRIARLMDIAHHHPGLTKKDTHD